MANRFWVGGTGSWNGTTTNWSATSGGPGGASFPTAADNVFFDANSGGGTVTIGATALCLDLTMTGWTGNLAGTSALSISGSFVAPTVGTIGGYTGTTSFLATTTGKTITCNGKTLGGSANFNGVGGGWTLADAFRASGAMSVLAGSFSDGGFSVTASSFFGSGSATRSITKSGNWTMTGPGTAITFATTTGLTANFDPTKDWVLSYNGATAIAVQFGTLPAVGNLKFANNGTYTFSPNGVSNAAGTFGDVDFTGFSGAMNASTLFMTGSLTLSPTMTVAAQAATVAILPPAGTTRTIKSNGVALSRAVNINGPGSVVLLDALSINQNFTLTQGGFDDGGFNVTALAFTSSGTPVRSITKNGDWTATGSGTSVLNFGTNTNLTMTADPAKAWTLAYSGAVATSITFGSVAGVGQLKVAAGTYTLTTNGSSAGAGTYSDIDFTGFAGVAAVNTITLTGNLTLSPLMTVTPGTNATTMLPAAGTTRFIKSNGVNWARPITVNAPGTVRLLDALNNSATSVSSGTLALLQGSFDDAGFSVTTFAFSSNVTTTRALFKSGNWTITGGNGTLINVGSATTMTTTCDPSKDWTLSSTGSTPIVVNMTTIFAGLGNLKFTGGTYNLTLGGFNTLDGTWNNIDFTGFSGQVQPSSTSMRGNLTISPTMTWATNSSVISMFAAPGVTVAIQSNGGIVGRSIQFDGSNNGVGGGGVLKLLDNLNLDGHPIGLFGGELNTNGKAVNAYGINASGLTTTTRQFTLTGSDFTLTGSGTVLGMFSALVSVPGAINVNALGATFHVTDTSPTSKFFRGGPFEYGTVEFAGAPGSSYDIGSSTSAAPMTIGNLKAMSLPLVLTVGRGTKLAVRELTNFMGTPDAPITVAGTTGVVGTQGLIDYLGDGVVDTDYVQMRDMACGPGYRWFLGAHGQNLGNNLGAAFAKPANVSLMALSA